MPKKTIGIRLESDYADDLATNAMRQNKTITQLVLEKLDQSRQYDVLESEFQSLQLQLRELQRIMKKKQVPKTRKISISFTLEQYENIKKLSHQEHTSMSRLLHGRLIKSDMIPALE